MPATRGLKTDELPFGLGVDLLIFGALFQSHFLVMAHFSSFAGLNFGF